MTRLPEINLESMQDGEKKRVMDKLVGKRIAISWGKRVMRGSIQTILESSFLFNAGNEKAAIRVDIHKIVSVRVYR